MNTFLNTNFPPKHTFGIENNTLLVLEGKEDYAQRVSTMMDSFNNSLQVEDEIWNILIQSLQAVNVYPTKPVTDDTLYQFYDWFLSKGQEANASGDAGPSAVQAEQYDDEVDWEHTEDGRLWIARKNADHEEAIGIWR